MRPVEYIGGTMKPYTEIDFWQFRDHTAITVSGKPREVDFGPRAASRRAGRLVAELALSPLTEPVSAGVAGRCLGMVMDLLRAHGKVRSFGDVQMMEAVVTRADDTRESFWVRSKESSSRPRPDLVEIDQRPDRLAALVSGGAVETNWFRVCESERLQVLRSGMFQTGGSGMTVRSPWPSIDGICVCVCFLPDDWILVSFESIRVDGKIWDRYFRCDGTFGLRACLDDCPQGWPSLKFTRRGS